MQDHETKRSRGFGYAAAASHCLAAGPVLASLALPPCTPVPTRGPGGARFITFADDAGAKAVFAAGEFHTIGSKQIQVKQATPRGSMTQPQPGSVAPGPGAGPSGSRMVFAPRPGFAGGFGGGMGQHPGAYGPVGAYGPPMQYHMGPGYGMPAYGQVRTRPLSPLLYRAHARQGCLPASLKSWCVTVCCCRLPFLDTAA